MKIYLCSDVHIEFGPLEVHNNDNADVLILSGDIVVASALKGWDNFGIKGIIEPSKSAQNFMNFFHQCSTKFKDVIYVMGNHEHYNGDFATSASILRSVLKEYPNIYLLDKESKTIGDIIFVGGTLWTDMNKENPDTLYHIRRMMNDFRIIQNGELPFTPENTVEDHKEMLKYIDGVTKDITKKYVVVGHHAPCKLSTKPKYADQHLVNGAYSSDLTEFILDRPQIKMWTHGHTHDAFDYMIGQTRIVCNPRGYIGHEKRAYEFDFLLLEV